MFREAAVEHGAASALERTTYHTVQSAAPPGWFLGFNLAPRSRFALRGGREGRGALARVGWRRPGASCGFRFHSQREKEEGGDEELMKAILKYVEDNSVVEGEERESTIVDSATRGGRGGAARRRRKGKGRTRPRQVRHLPKKQLRPDRKTKNQRRSKKNKRKPSMRRKPKQ
jgi:hypothetical protein